MKIFGFFKKDNDDRIIDFFKKNNLEEWWLSEFTAEEREHIISESSILLDSRYNYDKSTGEVLYLLAGYINTKNTEGYQHLALLILNKAVNITDDPLILFKIYSELINLNFEHRHDAEEIKVRIIELCREQIELSASVLELLNRDDDSDKKTSILEHPGYQKLAVLKIEDGELEQAEELIKKAKEEGWQGSWEELEIKLT